MKGSTAQYIAFIKDGMMEEAKGITREELKYVLLLEINSYFIEICNKIIF